MNYLQDRRHQQKKRKYASVTMLSGILAALVLIGVLARIVAGTSLGIARPLWKLRTSFSEKIDSYGSYFASKRSLQRENERLLGENEKLRLEVIDRNALGDENAELKELLGRTKDRSVVLGVVLAEPGQSLYDTMIIDIGNDHAIRIGARVFVGGQALVGRIAEVYDKTAKVSLYSAPGEKIEGLAVGTDTLLTLIGRGGGNFEIELPRDVNLPIGTSIISPDINTYVLGTVGDVTFDPRDPFQKVLVQSPVNIKEVRFVEIEKL